MKPIPIAEINRKLTPKDPLEQAQFGAALFEKCRLAHNAEPKTPEGKQRQKTLWLPRIRAACKLIAEARMLLPEPKGEFDVRFDKRAFLSSDIGAKQLRLIDIGKSFEKTPIHDTPDVDPLEDFTTYTEVDPANWISVTSHQIIITNMDRTYDAYVYKDFGIDHFSTFSHWHTTKMTSVSASIMAVGCTWAVSNTINDLYDWTRNTLQTLTSFWLWLYEAPYYRFYLRNCEYFNTQDDYAAVSINTTYYITTERSGTTAFAYIYSDSGRTTLVDTLSVPLDSSRKYRYLSTAISHHDNISSQFISYIVSDLDLRESAFQPAWAEGINTHHF